MKIAISFFSILLMAAVSPVLLRAQGSTDPKIVEVAKKEGEIIWFTSMSVDQSQPLMNAFQKKYPAIKPVLMRAGSGAIMNRVLTETHARMFDFDVVGSHGEMIQIFKKRGIIAPYISAKTKLVNADLFDKQSY